MTPRTLGLTDRLHEFLLQVGFREHPALKRVREETAKLPRGSHAGCAGTAPNSWPSLPARRRSAAVAPVSRLHMNIGSERPAPESRNTIDQIVTKRISPEHPRPFWGWGPEVAITYHNRLLPRRARWLMALENNLRGLLDRTAGREVVGDRDPQSAAAVVPNDQSGLHVPR